MKSIEERAKEYASGLDVYHYYEDQRPPYLVDGKASAGYIKGATDERALMSEEIIEALQYMCGYTDFPERKEGQGLYYWRTILRQKFEEIGIVIPVINKGEKI